MQLHYSAFPVMKITANNISRSYSGQELFSRVSFELEPGRRLAVTGPNGCGKSTLLSMLAGLTHPDSGSINRPQGLRTGFVAQDLDDSDLKIPLLEFVLSVLPDWSQFWRQWKKAVAEDDRQGLEKLSRRQAEMEQSCGYNPEYRAEKILTGLGFEKSRFHLPLEHFSGGWRERARLSRVLLQGADLLILDEPTNHLDMEAVLWLENYLLDFSGILVLVAHDRFFLDRVATHVLHLGFDRPYFRPGNYSSFEKWHQETQILREKEREKISSEIKHLKSFVDRFRYKASKARQAQARLARMDSLESRKKELQSDRAGKRLNFSWPAPARASRVAVTCSELFFRHPQGPELLNNVNFQLFDGHKIALMGQNGSGKSTLFKLITGRAAPDSGTIKLGHNTRPAYFTQHQTETLAAENTVLAEIKRLSSRDLTEEEVRSVLGLFLLDETFWDRKVQSLSGGEKSRLILSSLFLTRANLLLLDEPTNHLDMESREALIAALQDFPGAVFMIAHDRFLLSRVAGEVWTLENGHTVEHGMGFDEYYQRVVLKDQAGPELSRETGPGGSGRNNSPHKEKKRQEASLRNRIYRELQPLKKEYSEKEHSLEQSLLRQEELENAMSLPETCQDPDRLRELSREYREVCAQNDSLMHRLEELEQQITQLETAKP
ncbi:ABC-F family ATP-binding cassette domain-containing protein [Desulfonatronospira sp. MSAO_Bac3]|uniref:ABC-F family ATP-binding cassette domain-containing protein n=1 Tax=Desulfonatronospira sp. MSAO_Bac3 TaxID=2293857 RepID=UPI00257C6C70|nr:ABC-F family ATP-binding cassette domain-containing protein [Desulfonatronospira sp. MSAO_Bac3]